MACALLLGACSAVDAQDWNTGGNLINGTTQYLGCDAFSTQPLRLKTVANQPIDFSTSDIFRARINKKLTYPSLNTFANIVADGFTLLTPDNGFLGQSPNGPFSRLHLAEGGATGNAEQWGYRPWQRNGITFTGNTDQGYVGQKFREGSSGETDMVIQWSDNPGNWKGDRLRFIFTSAYDQGASTGMNSREGLEGMRLFPDADNFINVGVGDFYAGGDDPTERLDVRTGRVRIRQLPTDPQANTLDKYMVVDNAGVVKWRHLPPSSTTNCDWELNTGGHLLTSAWRPAGTNGNCPDERWKVGIGTASPQCKMEVIDVEDDTIPTIGGLRVDLRTNHLGWRYGVKSYLKPKAGGAQLDFGVSVLGDVVNVGLSAPGTTDGYGVYGRSTTDQALYLRGSYGVAGYATNSAGTIDQMLGGDFYGNNVGGAVTATYGVRGRAQSTVAGAKCYGVYGMAAVDTNSWAGYFQGKVRATNYMMASMYYTYSDASIKAGVENLEQADVSTKLAALVPRRYHYTPEAQERFGLPVGEQFGFVAQEVEAVVPELVVVSRMPEELDSSGTVIYPEMEIKAVNYQELIPLLVQGYQQQQATIAQLQQQVAQCCASDQGMAPQGYKVEPDDPAGDLQEQRLLIIPNPVADITTLEYYVPKAGKVSLSVSTSDGKPLGSLREEQAEPGAYSYPWNTTKLAAGTYFCTYMLDGQVVVKRAVKVGR